MALRLPTLRHRLRQPPANPRFSQRRWAQVHDVRFLATHDAQARVLAKYKHKLERAAKEHGLADISELKAQYKDKIDSLRKQAIVPGANAPLTPPPPQPPSTSNPTPKSPCPPTPPAPPGIKTLSSFLDLDKVRALPSKEIQALWRLRHASNPQSIHFAMPASVFESLLGAAKRHPSFVLPVPRELPADNTQSQESESSEAGKPHQAAELHYLQFSHPHTHTTTLLFTSLAEFKLRGEFASPHTTVTFHGELGASHGVVLGQGQVLADKGVSVDEARWLVMCMQKFYVQGGEGARGELLEGFTRGDEGFRVERLIDEAEKIL